MGLGIHIFLIHLTHIHLLKGVDHFIFIDNGSVDGSIDMLASQIDATVVRTRDCLTRHNEWVRHWFKQLPLNTWALILDMDEHFVCLPWERGGLKTTLEVLETSEAQIAVACMVDLYPAELPHQAVAPGTERLAGSRQVERCGARVL